MKRFFTTLVHALKRDTRRSKPQRQVRLTVEGLEDRQLLSASPGLDVLRPVVTAPAAMSPAIAQPVMASPFFQHMPPVLTHGTNSQAPTVNFQNVHFLRVSYMTGVMFAATEASSPVAAPMVSAAPAIKAGFTGIKISLPKPEIHYYLLQLHYLGTTPPIRTRGFVSGARFQPPTDIIIRLDAANGSAYYRVLGTVTAQSPPSRLPAIGELIPTAPQPQSGVYRLPGMFIGDYRVSSVDPYQPSLLNEVPTW